MTESSGFSNPAEALFNGWMKAYSDFLKGAAGTGDGQGQAGGPAGQGDFLERVMGQFQAALAGYQHLSAFLDPQTYQSMMQAPPIMGEKSAEGWFSTIADAQQQFFKQALDLATQARAVHLENLDHDVFRAWSDFYEHQVHGLFNLPALGLGRFYQERAMRLIDRFNRFQNTLSEFIHLFWLPIEKSSEIVQAEMEALDPEKLSETDYQDWYKKWIKVLEARYKVLLQSPEYLATLSKTLAALGDYNEARNAVLEDVIQSLPVPSRREMDDVYQELYHLKKELKRLKAQLPDQ
jgi:hypothetical protein